MRQSGLTRRQPHRLVIGLLRYEPDQDVVEKQAFGGLRAIVGQAELNGIVVVRLPPCPGHAGLVEQHGGLVTVGQSASPSLVASPNAHQASYRGGAYDVLVGMFRIALP